MNWRNIFLIVVIYSALLALILTPFFRRIAIWTNTLDKPAVQNHKNHKKTTPLMGGFAICSAWLITLLTGIYSPTFLAKQNFSQLIIDNLSGVFEVKNRLIAIIIGGVLITLLGFIDDRQNISAKLKFFGQIVIVAFVVFYGDIKITLFINSPLINSIIAVLWIVTIINAINFFDNMDGLAIGVAAIGFIFFTITAAIYHHNFVACLAAAGVGTTIGFWFYNHTPASIFMGDAGSHFLGYSLGITGAMTTYYQEGVTLTPLSVLIPIFILAIPLFDLLSVIIIRLKAGKPIYIGDNNHISHRFNKMGMSRKNAVLCVHLLSVIIGLSVLPLLWGDRSTTIVCLLQAGIILLLISVLQYCTKKMK
jgi:UDP-GlcNAc:undecaprenyl-phosphate/decaprenyl-phosphate GlcNAc-1-phosphate transferase